MRPILQLCIITVILLCSGGKAAPSADLAGAQTLQEAVSAAQAQFGLPALGAAVIDGDTITVALHGVRKLGTENAVTRSDLFHIGSCTKSVTATMIGTLVKDGLLRWDTHPAEVLPGLSATLDPGYAGVTLEQLLKHRAGIQPFTDGNEAQVLPAYSGTKPEQRLAFAKQFLSKPPASKVGEFAYSNAGYGIAAAMAEQATGQSWEELVVSRVCQPLGITPYFGWPLLAGSDQPWGHYLEGNTLIPHDPASGYTCLPAILAPAGDISLSVEDLAKYARMHLQGLRGATGFLPADVMAALHRPEGDYAMGWEVQTHGEDQILRHTGSAGTFYAYILLRPYKNDALVIVTNAVSEQHDQAFQAVQDWIIAHQAKAE